MRVMDLLRNWGNPINLNTKPQIIIASRPPTNLDIPDVPWWYDRNKKVMYRSTENGYIED